VEGTSKLIAKIAPNADPAKVGKCLSHRFNKVANAIGDKDGKLDGCEFRAMIEHGFEPNCNAECQAYFDGECTKHGHPASGPAGVEEFYASLDHHHHSDSESSSSDSHDHHHHHSDSDGHHHHHGHHHHDHGHHHHDHGHDHHDHHHHGLVVHMGDIHVHEE